MNDKIPPDVSDRLNDIGVTLRKNIEVEIEPEEDYEGDLVRATIVFEWTSDFDDRVYRFSEDRTLFSPELEEYERQEVVSKIRESYVNDGYPIDPLPWEV